MSLDTMQLWPFRYVLRCQPRTDLDSSLGTLPDHSLYIGSSNSLNNRLCFHFQSNEHGTMWTKTFQPLAVEQLCVKRPTGTKECLRWEDEMVIDAMAIIMWQYTHPEAWRCVGGGSWSKPTNKCMPAPLRRRLDKTN